MRMRKEGRHGSQIGEVLANLSREARTGEAHRRAWNKHPTGSMRCPWRDSYPAFSTDSEIAHQVLMALLGQ